MKVLVAGWFSFPDMGATAGDLLARDLVCQWLRDAGRAYDVALVPPFEFGVDWTTADPAAYSEVVFVCGPFGNGWPVQDFLARFAGRRMIGVNLSMLDPLDVWNPFDVLLERDSSRTARPDVTFLTSAPRVPVAGLVLVHKQTEYVDGAHDRAEAALRDLIALRPMAVVPIDTRLDLNSTGARSAAEVESVIARMDVILTTRLHGMVLALKNGVPVVAVDPIAGGAKLRRQADALGWRVFIADSVVVDDLLEMFDYCVTADARLRAAECAKQAQLGLADVRERFLHAVTVARSVG